MPSAAPARKSCRWTLPVEPRSRTAARAPGSSSPDVETRCARARRARARRCCSCTATPTAPTPGARCSSGSAEARPGRDGDRPDRLRHRLRARSRRARCCPSGTSSSRRRSSELSERNGGGEVHRRRQLARRLPGDARRRSTPTCRSAGSSRSRPPASHMARWFPIIEGERLIRLLRLSPVPVPEVVVREIVGRVYRTLAFHDPSGADPARGRRVRRATSARVERSMARARRRPSPAAGAREPLRPGARSTARCCSSGESGTGWSTRPAPSGCCAPSTTPTSRCSPTAATARRSRCPTGSPSS